jgi:site-specific recombinase XerD
MPIFKPTFSMQRVDSPEFLEFPGWVYLLFATFQTVDLRRKEGFRDYVLLHLLFDSGARASEIAGLNVD